MRERAFVVLDVGKTLAKLSLWSAQGEVLAREARPNERIETGQYAALDVSGIEGWLAETLSEFAKLADVGHIIPVSHGAGVVIIRDGELACQPLDYEDAMPAALRKEYDALRDSYIETGSPALPDGLNLGAQIYRLQTLYPDLLAGDEIIMPWAQYWSWKLCGVPAMEVTSLGCHSDLWLPVEKAYSKLAQSQGWAKHFPRLTRAGDKLGPLDAEWVAKTGLASDVQVHCGLHDSNAALWAARSFTEISNSESTVLSTGTWFVAMRSPGQDADFSIASLPEERDCLVNVDVDGNPVPSARFMGGREIETLSGLDTRRVDIKPDQPALVGAVADVVRDGAMVLPTFTTGVGPFPHGRGRWVNMPVDQYARRAAVCLYAALVAAASLQLIGTRERILVEGRFAEAEVFVRALASLFPDASVYVSNAHNDVSFGALRLLKPDLEPDSSLVRVAPLDVDLSDYRKAWQREAERMEDAA